MTDPNAPGNGSANSDVLLLLTRRPGPEEASVLRALSRGAGPGRLSALLVDAAVVFVEDRAAAELPIDWLLLAEDARGRGVRASPGVSLTEVDYAEAVRRLFEASRVVGLP